MMYRPIVSILPLFAVIAVAQPPQANTPTTLVQAGKLELRRPVDRTIGRRESDLFTLDVASGKFVRVVVQHKRGPSLIVSITDPNGERLVTASRPFAEGSISACAMILQTGTIQIAVQWAGGAGQYTVEVTDLRDPEEPDRLRIEAEGKLFLGLQEIRSRDPQTSEKGAEHIIEAASLWGRLADGYEQSLCFDTLGLIYTLIRKDFAKALDAYQKALAIRHESADRLGESLTLYNIGHLWFLQHDPRKALDYQTQALAIQREIGDRFNEGQTLREMGNLYGALEEKGRAIDSLTQALSLFRSLGEQGRETEAIAALDALYRLPSASKVSPPLTQVSGLAMNESRLQLVAQAGQMSRPTALVFSPDGRYLLSAGERFAVLWSVRDGKELRVFGGHEDTITCVAFLPDGTGIVTGSRDRTVRVWDVSTGRELQRITDSRPVGSISVSPTGALIADTGDDIRGSNIAHVWDKASGRQILALEGHTDSIRTISFSADGKWLATGSADHSARLWDAASGKEVRRFAGHQSTVNAVTFSPDGSILASGSGVGSGPDITKALLRGANPLAEDHTVRLWDLKSGNEEKSFGAPGAVLALAFSPDGHYLASAGGTPFMGVRLDGQPVSTEGMTGYNVGTCSGCEIRVWNLGTGKEVDRSSSAGPPSSTVLSPPPAGSVFRAMALSPVENLLAWGTEKEVTISPIGSNNAPSHLRGYAVPLSLASHAVRSILMGDGTAQLGDPAPVRYGPEGVLGRGWSGGYTLRPGESLAPNGKLVAVELDSRIAVVDPSTNKELRSIPIAGGPHVISFSSDNRLLLTAGKYMPVRGEGPYRPLAGPLCAVDIRSGVTRTCVGGAEEGFSSAFFSPTGDAIIAVSQAGEPLKINVRVWDSTSGAELRFFKTIGFGDFMFGAAIAPTGQMIAINANSTVLYDWQEGEVVREIFTGRGSLTFSPDGRWLAVGGASTTIWNTSSGLEIWDFSSGYASEIEFTADSRFVVTTGPSGILTFWSLASGRELCSLFSFTDGSWAVTDPEGRYDASNPDEAIGLHWVAGTDVIELGQLKQRFYTPGLLARALKGEKLPDVASIQTIKLPPNLEVLHLSAGSTKVNVKVTNRGGGIGRIVVKVNGKEIAAEARGRRADANAPAAQLAVDLSAAVRAPDGKNTVEVFAYDGGNLVSSRGFQTIWETQPTTSKPTRLFAVVAGVSEYDNSALNLKYAAKDAETMALALQLGAKGLNEQVSLHLLSTSGIAGSAMPTKAEFRKAFESIEREAESQDVLVIYVAGHGVARRGVADRYYFLTQSARSTELPANDPAMLDFAAVSSEELKTWCKRIRALKQVIILDTCAAGAAGQELLKLADRRELSPDQIRAIELLKDSTGSHILMGSAADAVSYEASRYGQGLLTYALLEGMKGAALDEGQKVDVRKLFDFTQREVKQLARGIGGVQAPLVSSPPGSSFPIGFLTDADKRAIPLAMARPQLLQVECRDAGLGDPQGLTARVRSLLRAASQPATRGQPRPEPAIVYLDGVTEDFPGAFSPRVLYQVQDSTLEAEIHLFRDNQQISDEKISVAADPMTAARAIADAVIKAATRIGVQ